MKTQHDLDLDPHPHAPTGNGSPAPALFPPGSSNGAGRALPTRAPRRNNWLLYLLTVGSAVVLLGGGIAAFLYFRPAAARPDVLTHTVKREPLNVAVTEKGTLESAQNMDLICKVKAGNKGFATSINWVIDDGSRVKKDQLLMILDDSALQDQFQTQFIAVKNAMSEKVKAEKDYEIAVQENARLIAEAENTLAVAQITLEKYTGIDYDPAKVGLATVCGVAAALAEGGEFRQKLDDLNGQIRLEESNYEQYLERTAWADRMVKQRYMSPAQAQAEHSKLDSSREKLRSLVAQRKSLVGFDRRMELTDRFSKVENARLLVNKQKIAVEATRVQAEILRDTKNAVYTQELTKLHDIEEQIKECKIYSPQDGMVVYYKNESGRWGSTPQGMIEQGAQVKEGQKLLRIPNLTVMQVNTKVHEAMVGRIHGDVRVSTGIFEGFRTGLMSNPDPFSRLLSQRDDFLEMVRDKYKNKEYRTTTLGQRATVRVDAVHGGVVFPGHVRSVAGVASQADSWVSDVKLYQTIVLLEGSVEGLKPDMTAEVTIHVDGVDKVLTVPMQAIVGGAEMGAKRKLFVKTADGYVEKEVTLGLYNDKMVEVRDGIDEGDEVVINPKVLLTDSSTKTRDGVDGGNGNGKGKGGNGKGSYEGKGSDPAKGGGGDPAKRGGKKGGGGGGKGQGQSQGPPA